MVNSFWCFTANSFWCFTADETQWLLKSDKSAKFFRRAGCGVGAISLTRIATGGLCFSQAAAHLFLATLVPVLAVQPRVDDDRRMRSSKYSLDYCDVRIPVAAGASPGRFFDAVSDAPAEMRAARAHA